MTFDVIVIGGGAAGLFSARTAALRGRRVLVIESNERPGRKILISGGGRCNFTNIEATAANYVTQGSRDFMRSALAGFTPSDFIELVEQHGIRWHEKKLGQLFCDHSSKEVLQLLERECNQADVVIQTRCRTSSVSRRGPVDRESDSGKRSAGRAHAWEVATDAGSFRSQSLVIATGGLSFSKLGATSFGYDIARQFQLPLVPTRPGLVPLTWSPPDRELYEQLSGVAIPCETSVDGCRDVFREQLLFTHRGLSGPAILQISNFWHSGSRLTVNLLPEDNALELLLAHRQGGHDVRSALKGRLPERFVKVWCARYAPARPIAQMTRAELENVARRLNAWEIKPAGDEGYDKAEVTLGGVDTGALSSRTMECRSVPGLFFAGEVVDVTGWLGGYNFQWAWSSGHAAGSAA